MADVQEKLLNEIQQLVQVLSALKKEELNMAAPIAKRIKKLNRKLKIDSRIQLDLDAMADLVLRAENVSGIRLRAKEMLVILAMLQTRLREHQEQKIILEMQKKMKKGPVQTYGRFMTRAEYKRMQITKMLESADPEQLIPCFGTPVHVHEYLWKLRKKAVHNLYVQIGGTGDMDCIAIFKTQIQPEQGPIPLRRIALLQEFKFLHGTPIEIVDVRFV